MALSQDNLTPLERQVFTVLLRRKMLGEGRWPAPANISRQLNYMMGRTEGASAETRIGWLRKQEADAGREWPE